jgi:hypothetical protein
LVLRAGQWTQGINTDAGKRLTTVACPSCLHSAAD